MKEMLLKPENRVMYPAGEFGYVFIEKSSSAR